MNENESQNLHEYLINFIAVDDFLPNGGFPIICILLYLFISFLKLKFKILFYYITMFWFNIKK